MKHAQEAPQVYFKVRAELARNLIFLGEIERALEEIEFCEQILVSRHFEPNTPPIVNVMDLQDIFTLAEIVAMLNDRKKVDEYIDLYQKRLAAIAGEKSPLHI